VDAPLLLLLLLLLPLLLLLLLLLLPLLLPLLLLLLPLLLLVIVLLPPLLLVVLLLMAVLAASPELVLLPPPQADSAIDANSQTTVAFLMSSPFGHFPSHLKCPARWLTLHYFAFKTMSPATDTALIQTENRAPNEDCFVIDTRRQKESPQCP
jgi:hypothetical protein